MHQVKDGNQWYFGMNAHIGVDADSGLVHQPLSIWPLISTTSRRVMHCCTEQKSMDSPMLDTKALPNALKLQTSNGISPCAPVSARLWKRRRNLSPCSTKSRSSIPECALRLSIRSGSSSLAIARNQPDRAKNSERNCHQFVQKHIFFRFVNSTCLPRHAAGVMQIIPGAVAI